MGCDRRQGHIDVSRIHNSIKDTVFFAPGFTLLELVTTVAIVGIVSAMAISLYQTSVAKNRIGTEINTFMTDLTFAAAEAVRTGQDVTLCVSVNGTSCSTSTLWSQGWIIFDDPTGSQQTVTGTVIRRRQPAFSGGDSFTADNAIAAVTWNRGGYVSSIAPTIAQVTFTDHASTVSTATTLCVALGFLGQVTSENPGQGNCQ